MLFNSIHYLIFLPVIFILYYLLPQKLRNPMLLMASYYFYMCWIPQYALLMLFSTVTTWACGFAVEKITHPKYRKLALFLNITINLSILFVFKYYHFFMDSLAAFLGAVNIAFVAPPVSVLLPVGISFYTFQSLGYSIDVYRKDVPHEHNFFIYALFVSFFPQLVAGPIERTGNLLPQFYRRHKFNYRQAVEGVFHILIGFLKKIVIADTLAVFVNTIFADIGAYSGGTLAITAVAFSIQLYCDFAGYSSIAIGSAKLLGFELMKNFNAPYLAPSMGAFWRRWHISLSTWFKDYLYIPLGGSRCSVLRKNINQFFVFVVSGLWHGAAWTYVFWGALNGLYLVIENITAPLRKAGYAKLKLDQDSWFVKPFRILFTFTLSVFAYIFFRSETLADAFLFIRRLSLRSTASLGQLFYNIYLENCHGLAFYANVWIVILFMGLVLLLADDLYVNRNLNNHTTWIEKLPRPLRWPLYYTMPLLCIVCFALQNSALSEAVEFIYFRF